MGRNDEIRDDVVRFLEDRRQADLTWLANLVNIDGPVGLDGSRIVAQPDAVKHEWEWSPTSVSRPHGLYRADVAVTAEAVPLLIVEVDVSTSGKGAVGALLMAALASRDQRASSDEAKIFTPRVWFQVVTEAPKQRQKYHERLSVAYEYLQKGRFQVGEGGYIPPERLPLVMGEDVLLASEVHDQAAWDRVRPTDLPQACERLVDSNPIR